MLAPPTVPEFTGVVSAAGTENPCTSTVHGQLLGAVFSDRSSDPESEEPSPSSPPSTMALVLVESIGGLMNNSTEVSTVSSGSSTAVKKTMPP